LPVERRAAPTFSLWACAGITNVLKSSGKIRYVPLQPLGEDAFFNVNGTAMAAGTAYGHHDAAIAEV
jgi:hypothetical protein